MKRIFYLLLTVCIFAMSGCSSTPSSESNDKSKTSTNLLTDKGVELITKVDKLAECEEYINLSTPNDKIADVIKGIADNDYTKPQGVFVIGNLDTMILESMMPETKLPEDIEKMVIGKFASALPSQITGMNGVTALAATAILSYGESFIFEGLQSSVIYLYTYGNENGFMVTYNPTDENIVSANVAIVINDQLPKCISKDEVSNFLKNAFDFEDVSVSIATEE